MKVNELRIGSLVFQGKDIATIYQIERRYKSVFRVNDIDFDEIIIEDKFQPIPLTEDWLLKLGFKLVTKEGNQGEFKIYSLNEISFNTIHGWWWKHRLDVQPKYVHQLQNLFFALTGQELEINEPAT